MNRKFFFTLLCILSFMLFQSCNNGSENNDSQEDNNSQENNNFQEINISYLANYKAAFKGSRSFITQPSRNARSNQNDNNQDILMIVTDDNRIEELQIFDKNGNKIDATATDVFKVANYTGIIVKFNQNNTTKKYLVSPDGSTYDVTNLEGFECAYAHNDYLYYLNNYTIYRTRFNELKSEPINNSNYIPLFHFYIMKDDTVLAINDEGNDSTYVFPPDGSRPLEYGEYSALCLYNNQYENENTGYRIFSFFNDSDGNLYLIRSIGEHFELINIYTQNNQLVYDIIDSLYLKDLDERIDGNWWFLNSYGLTVTANTFDRIAIPIITQDEQFTKIILQVDVKNKVNPLSYITLRNSTLGNITTSELLVDDDYLYYETTGTKKIKRINLWNENAVEEIIVEDDALISKTWSLLGESVIYHTFVTATNINTLRAEFGKEPVVVNNSIVDPIDIIKIK